jgi:AhpC/TSA antioxidant enzyme
MHNIRMMSFPEQIGRARSFRCIGHRLSGEFFFSIYIKTGCNVLLMWNNCRFGMKQRPMELASVRLQNMMDILPSWDKLIPSNLELITQQGGTFVTNEEGNIIFEHRDTGILKYVNLEMALAAAGVVL